MNCGLDPILMQPIVEKFAKTAHVPIICNPNAGPPKMANGQAVYDLTPDEFAEAMRKIAECGAG